MLRSTIIIGALLLGFVVLSPWGEAQEPLTREQRMRKLIIQRQMKCLKRCENKGYRWFYRCGPEGSSYCKARAGINFRACIRGCEATWFCKGYRRAVQPRCPKLCLNERKKSQPKQRWRRRPSRRQFQRWAKKYLRWQKRTRYACKSLCLDYNQVCNIRASVKLPPRVRLPDLQDLK